MQYARSPRSRARRKVGRARGRGRGRAHWPYLKKRTQSRSRGGPREHSGRWLRNWNHGRIEGFPGGSYIYYSGLLRRSKWGDPTDLKEGLSKLLQNLRNEPNFLFSDDQDHADS